MKKQEECTCICHTGAHCGFDAMRYNFESCEHCTPLPKSEGYDKDYNNAIYEQMENFRRNPSNGNRYFEAVLEIAEKKQQSLLDTQKREIVEKIEKALKIDTFDQESTRWLNEEEWQQLKKDLLLQKKNTY